MKHRRWAAGLTTLASAALLVSVQTTTASAATFTAELVARHSQKCASVENASTQNNARVIQYNCVNGTNQQWKLVATSAGYYTISAVNSHKCLSVEGASTQNGAKAVQFECQGGTNQEWRLVQKDSGYFSIEARHSGKCLSVTNASTQNGATLIQYDCVEGHNQHFRLG